MEALNWPPHSFRRGAGAGSPVLGKLGALRLISIPIAAAIACAVIARGRETPSPAHGAAGHHAARFRGYWARLYTRQFFRWKVDCILGGVIRRVEKHDLAGTNLYYVRVLADYRQQFRRGQIVILRGRRGPGGRGSWGGSWLPAFAPKIPISRPPAVVLFAARPTAGAKALKLCRASLLGFRTPIRVSRGSQAQLERSIRLMAKLVPSAGRGRPPIRDAEKLLASKNYSAWALGVSLVAAERTRSAVTVLLSQLKIPHITIRRDAWIAYCLIDARAPAFPGGGDLCADFYAALARHSGSLRGGYAGRVARLRGRKVRRPQ